MPSTKCSFVFLSVWSAAPNQSRVVDDLARQKTQVVSKQAEPKRQKFRQSRLMIGVIGTRMEEGGAGEGYRFLPKRGLAAPWWPR